MRIQNEQPVTQTRTCKDCCKRAVSRFRMYCYLDPQEGIRMPTYCERIQSALRGLCGGAYAGLVTAGCFTMLAIVSEQADVIINRDLYLKSVISIFSAPAGTGAIHGALHPPRSWLV